MYVLFSPGKPESGIIPSEQIHSTMNIYNFPGKELNVTNITSLRKQKSVTLGL